MKIGGSMEVGIDFGVGQGWTVNGVSVSVNGVHSSPHASTILVSPLEFSHFLLFPVLPFVFFPG